ncbi:MAG: asparaginase domain-containing protein [Sulfurovum sp.]|nr:asparaginase domain-containing protein [Sulfurovum sp.]
MSTGGTFNKIYNAQNGLLQIDSTAQSLQDLADKWLCTLDTTTLIGKDSLDFTLTDRQVLLEAIENANYTDIIIIHGTDTLDITAKYLAAHLHTKIVVLTGAMVPYSIDPIEATANFSCAYGYINALEKHGVYIVMNGLMGHYKEVKKDRKLGKFIKNI